MLSGSFPSVTERTPEKEFRGHVKASLLREGLGLNGASEQRFLYTAPECKKMWNANLSPNAA